MVIIQQAKRNLLTGYLHFFILSLLMLLLTPFYIRQLGVETYGYWAVLNSIIAYLTILDFGLSLASTKFTAESIAKGDASQKSFLLSQIFFLYLLISILVIILGAFLAWFLPNFFQIPVNSWHSAILASFLMVLNLVFNLFSNFFVGISFGHQKQEVPNIIAALSAILQGALSYWFLIIGLGIVGLASAVLICGTLGLVFRILYCSRKFGPLGISLRACQSAPWGPLLRFGGGVFITSIGGQVILNTDNILIGKILDLKLVTAYSLVYMLVMSAAVIFQRISDVFFPVLTDNYTKSDFKNLNFYFSESTFLALVGYTSFAIAMACFGEDIISIWVGPKTWIGNKTLWVILSFFWFQVYIHGHANLLISSGVIRPIVRLNISEAIFNFFLSFLLIYKFGAFGVALGSLISMLFTNYIFLPKYTSNILQVGRLDSDRKLTFAVLLPSIPILTLGLFVKKVFILQGLVQIICSFVFISISYLLLLLLIIGSEKRSWYFDKFSNLMFSTRASCKTG